MGYAIGIDLGTTNSAVAVLKESGTPEILMNQEGDSTTPSVVLFQDFGDGVDEPLVGILAKRQAAVSPDDIVQYVKRFMGDPQWRFDSPADRAYKAEEISAIILARLKQDAELALGEPVTDAVITVPAYFDDARRTATKQAGEIAGFNVLRLINEPTAAAISYGFDTANNGTVLVYDLGGGTFDVTILKITDGNLEVLATDGDRNLGGFDFDNAIMTFVAQKLESEGVTDLLDDPNVVADLREKAEFAKKALSNRPNVNIQVSFKGQHHRVAMSREDFEAASASLMRRTMELVEDVLDDANMTWVDIDHLLLVGGSTRMPMVRETLKAASGMEPALDVNPDEAVALGAAVQAALELASRGTTGASDTDAAIPELDLSISDVTSQALGVISLGERDGRIDVDVNNVLIARNTPIPTQSSQQFFTVVDNQTEIRLRVTQGEDLDPDFVTVIGESTFSIPPYPAQSPIEVIFRYDIDQTVEIELMDLVAGKSLGTFEIDRTANMDAEEVEAAVNRISSLNIN